MNSLPSCTTPKKLTNHKFLNLFSTEIHSAKGILPWVFASRKRKPGAFIHQADAVVVIAIIQQEGEAHLVLTREYRGPLGSYEISTPSGLIDPGEKPVQAATREFNEETGLVLTRITHVSPPLASSAGLTDETISLVYGEADGVINREHQTEHEDIEVQLVNITAIRKMLSSPQSDIISSRLYPILITYAEAGKLGLPFVP